MIKIVPRLQDHNIFGCEWIFKVKEDQREDGALGSRCKARLGAKEYSQVKGVDYTKKISSVVKFISICIKFSWVAFFDSHLHQMDMVTAFTYGKRQNEVLMEQEKGFIHDDE